MITLYHCFDGRSFRPLWALEELGIPYQLEMLPFPPRAYSPDYMAINPVGTIPFLRDGAVGMTESVAICQYLDSRYAGNRLTLSPDDEHFGAYLNWSHYGEATLTFPQTLVLRYSFLEEGDSRNKQVADDYTRWFLGRLRAVTAALADGRRYLCGERFTIADISVGYAIQLAGMLNLSERFSPEISIYWEHLQTREGFKQAKQAQARASEEAMAHWPAAWVAGEERARSWRG